MSPFLQTIGLTGGNCARSRMIFPKVTLGFVNIVLLFAAVILGIGYLILINGSIASGYQIKDLEKKMVVLAEENKKLELNLTNLETRETIKNRIAELDLAPAEKVNYITPSAEGVAKK